MPTERLRSLNEELLRVPPDFTVHPKLLRQLERRRETIASRRHRVGAGGGAGVRLAARGRNLDPSLGSGHRARDVRAPPPRYHDHGTGETFAPIQHLDGASASFEVYNSPLSEYASLGFEYGYSVAAPDALVLWEAQYGDFVNGAQIVIDQFVVAGRSKWNQTSRLTLLLPHGYEGNGPEHSSARLERFLQLGAQENIRVVNCTTAAQFFHLLRRQALDAVARPLVVMTPKGLLRLKPASSTLDELAQGRFQPVLDDPTADRSSVERLVLCSGKLYYDIIGHEAHEPSGRAGVARLEQLYPFPVDAVETLLRRYPRLREVVWAQEEPQNMGPWRSIRHRLEETVRATPAESVHYVGRTWKASPSEGYPTAHHREQDRIVRESRSASPSSPERSVQPIDTATLRRGSATS